MTNIACPAMPKRTQTMSFVGQSRTLIAAAILASAFLSFTLQPLIGKLILPQAGGSPAAWASAMMVYQALLLAGYLWAHIVAKTSGKVQAMLHGGLALLVMVTLSISGPLEINSISGQNLGLSVPWAILAAAGLPLLVLFAQAPMLQIWYHRIAPGENPYRLYVASNIGSFSGLIAYPLIIEPLLTTSTQALVHRAAMIAVLAIIASIAVRLWATKADETDVSENQKATPAVKMQWLWIAIPAATTMLMMAVTNHITTDIAAMPLLWAIPLGLYLLSYSIAFRDSDAPVLKRTSILALIILCALSGGAGGSPFIMVAHVVAMAFVLIAMHRKLYQSRPPVEGMTSFYLAIAIGGALGGLFVGLIAPLLFDWIYEYAIAALLCVAILVSGHSQDNEQPVIGKRVRHTIMVLALLLAIGSAVKTQVSSAPDPILAIITAIVLANFVMIEQLKHRFIIGAALVALLAGGLVTQVGQSLNGDRMRNYFGILQVKKTHEKGADLRVLMHGTTVHGFEVENTSGRPRAVSYYGPGSGIARIISAQSSYRPDLAVTVLGLGSGAIACSLPEGTQTTFIEIDPDMVALAKRRFSFLDGCNKATTRIIIGDGRQEMVRLAGKSNDIFLMDAFSSDSIPTHLITAEALDIALKTRSAPTSNAPGGVVVVHVSNRYLDIAPMLAAYADSRRLDARVFKDDGNAQQLRSPSRYVVIGDVSDLQRVAPLKDGWKALDGSKAYLWTDSYSPIIRALF